MKLSDGYSVINETIELCDICMKGVCKRKYPIRFLIPCLLLKAYMKIQKYRFERIMRIAKDMGANTETLDEIGIKVNPNFMREFEEVKDQVDKLLKLVKQE